MDRVLNFDKREAGQVWKLKAWPSSLYLLLFVDVEELDGEVWAALNLETGEVHDAYFFDNGTLNVRVA